MIPKVTLSLPFSCSPHLYSTNQIGKEKTRSLESVNLGPLHLGFLWRQKRRDRVISPSEEIILAWEYVMNQHYLAVCRVKEYFSEVAKQKCVGRTSTMISDSLHSFLLFCLAVYLKSLYSSFVNFLRDVHSWTSQWNKCHWLGNSNVVCQRWKSFSLLSSRQMSPRKIFHSSSANYLLETLRFTFLKF